MAKKLESQQPSKQIAIADLPRKRHLDYQDFYAYFAMVQNSPFDVVVHFSYVDFREETSGAKPKKGVPPSLIDRCTVRMPPIVALQLAEALTEHVQKHRKEFIGYDPVDLGKKIEASKGNLKQATSEPDSLDGD